MNLKYIVLKAVLFVGFFVSVLGYDFFMGYNFVVEIGGVVVGGFSEVSGLSSDIELEFYEEGGLNGFVYKFFKYIIYLNLVLNWGLVNIDLFYIWY